MKNMIKSKMKKLSVKLFFCVMMLGVGMLTGCGGNADDKTTVNNNVDINYVAESLLKDVTFKDQLAKIDNEIAFTRLYNLDSEKIEDAVFYTNSNATAEEIAVVKTKDAAYVNDVKSSYEARISDQKSACENYLPDEMPKLDSAIIYTTGNYAVLCISADNDSAKEKIKEYFK